MVVLGEQALELVVSSSKHDIVVCWRLQRIQATRKQASATLPLLVLDTNIAGCFQLVNGAHIPCAYMISKLLSLVSLLCRTPWLGSTTSSVIAEASAPDHDTYSLDGVSVADSEAERQGFEWVECEGGEMVLDVAPLAGRVVIGLSGALEYALLPSSGQGPGADMVFVRAWCG